MSRHNLFIDCRILQYGDRHRGMGIHSFEILKTLLTKISKDSKVNVYLIFDNGLPIESEFSKINSYFSNLRYIRLNLPSFSVKKEVSKQIYNLRLILNKKLNKFLKSNNNSFVILSNFSTGQFVSAFPNKTKKIILIYDLIPHLFQNLYISDSNSFIHDDYYDRFKNLYDADLILTTSDSNKNDIVNFCNINPDKILSINVNLFDSYKDKATAKKPGIKKFILMPSGDDARKNNERAIAAFSFISKIFPELSLVITSSFTENTKKLLLDTAKSINKKVNIIFTGYVTEGQLVWLYKNAEAVLFPSLYEGFGLPILEAVYYKKKIVCSRIPAFEEFSKNGFFYCDPYSVLDIIKTIYKSLRSESILEKEYKMIIDAYSSSKNIDKLIVFITNNNLANIHLKKRIAIVGPILTGYSAVAKYCENMIAALYDFYHIDYYYDEGLNNTSFRNSIFSRLVNYRPIKLLNKKSLSKYIDIIYNVGNSEFHINTVNAALVYPGTIIIHDVKLNGLYEFALHNNLLDRKRYQLEISLEKQILNIKSELKEPFMISSLVNSAKKIICNSEYAFKIIKSLNTKRVPIYKINPPIVYENSSLTTSRSITNKIRVGFAGILTKHKGISLIEQMSRLKKINISLFGYSHLTTDLSLSKKVFFTDNLTDYEYIRQVSNNDIIITYREKYHGETSWTVLESMNNGVSVIVKRIGWFDEIPNDCCIKVNSTEEILELIRSKRINKRMLSEISSNAYSYIKYNYSFEKFAFAIKKLYE